MCICVCVWLCVYVCGRVCVGVCIFLQHMKSPNEMISFNLPFNSRKICDEIELRKLPWWCHVLSKADLFSLWIDPPFSMQKHRGQVFKMNTFLHFTTLKQNGTHLFDILREIVFPWILREITTYIHTAVKLKQLERIIIIHKKHSHDLKFSQWKFWKKKMKDNKIKIMYI